METGLMNDPAMPLPQAASTDPTQVPFAFGMIAMESLSQIEKREQDRAAATAATNKPVIQGLAAYVRECWSAAFNAKRTTNVEQRMLQSMRQRRGEYDPEVLTEIKKQGGSEIYMMLSSNKARAASSWIRDVMLGANKDKPWTITPTPMPDLPPSIHQAIQQLAQQEAMQFQQMTGQMVGPQEMEKVAAYVKDRVVANAKKRADEACARMELKMEDQLAEGKFARAMGEFIEDIATFPAAFIVGPIVRNKKALQWVPGPDGSFTADVTDQLTLEWERGDPFMMYPAPHATDVDDGYLIRRHKLTRSALNELIGVEGYDDAAIRTVLDEHGKGGLHEWLIIDTQKAAVEGKSAAMILSNPEATIDALQFWGSVQGKMLVDWGMEEIAVPEPTKEYQCEVWLIGNWVIKAQLNADPMGRKPVYKASYEEVPGAFWGNSVMDLCRDTATQCNTAARAIANNMGIGSGPQVSYNVDRLPTGEDLTAMYPWKVWQTTSDPYGSTGKAVEFFMPPMVARELIDIYSFFSNLADEHTGVPRYMTGDMGGSSAMRTASQTSMMMNNAGKAIKQVIANIDQNVLQPLIERLHFYNMKFGTDPELKGDIKVVARGANSLIVKETQQQRINEFLQLALTNPIVNQIVGEESIAALLRMAAKNLDMDTDQIVPPPEIIRARVFQQQQQMAAAQKAQQDFQMAMSLAPSHEVEVERGPNGEMVGMKVLDKQPHVMNMPGVAAPAGMAGGSPAQTMTDSGQQLADGSPVTDSFSPMRGQ